MDFNFEILEKTTTGITSDFSDTISVPTGEVWYVDSVNWFCRGDGDGYENDFEPVMEAGYVPKQGILDHGNLGVGEIPDTEVQGGPDTGSDEGFYRVGCGWYLDDREELIYQLNRTKQATWDVWVFIKRVL